jgi:cell wall-associated NlpC family hydrolase
MACRHQRGRGGTNPWLILLAVVAVLAFASNTRHAATPAAKGGHRATLTVKASPAAATAVAFATAQDGDAYVWGGNGPAVSGGWDCSGLVTAAWAKAGVSIMRTADSEWHSLPHVPTSRLEPGDLLFYAGADGTTADPGHVAMFIGHDRMVEAYSRLIGVRVTSVRWGDLIGAARP